MARRQIAILGGGVASLVTAFELTRTPELAARHDVTIYQMGWRLGGKGASGRNLSPGRGLRIEEHGLHVWLGFYENAFALMKAVYAARPTAPDEVLLTWRDAFRPQSFTPIGENVDGDWTYWGIDWPTNADEPGDGKLLLSPWGVFTERVDAIDRLVAAWREGARSAFGAADGDPAAGLVAMIVEGAERLAEEPLGDVVTRVRALSCDPREHDPGEHATLSGRLGDLKASLAGHARAAAAADHQLRWLWNTLDICIAIARGMLDPRYVVLVQGDLERIDGYDLRAWLIENGADPEVVKTGSEVRALYDLAFAYDEGRLERPSYAAGTALRAALRILLTYKGAILYLMQAGMGEAVVAPLYEVLRARGVKVELFHKVTKLELSPDRNVVARVRLARQARAKAGRDYAPTFRVKGVTAWPSEPFWDQLEDGEKMRAAGVSFESHWDASPPVEEVVLEVGRDFDTVVLGIALGAFKRLNTEPTMCDELYEASPRFAAMAGALSLVPTMAVQLWTTPTLRQLGWTDKKPAGDAWPELLDVWADMSQELAREAWDGESETSGNPKPRGPRSIQYFCSIYPTDLHTRPSTERTVPARALAEVRARAIDWFSKYTGFMWPEATTEDDPRALDYRVLFDPNDGVGTARFDAQWIRANVDPTECCVGSVEGSTAARLGADESTFVNLVLAGDWTRNGMNTACVEGAVMSGMAASRAICGSPVKIVGEDFFRKAR